MTASQKHHRRKVQPIRNLTLFEMGKPEEAAELTSQGLNAHTLCREFCSALPLSPQMVGKVRSIHRACSRVKLFCATRMPPTLRGAWPCHGKVLLGLVEQETIEFVIPSATST
jgi:hypothetical protein